MGCLCHNHNYKMKLESQLIDLFIMSQYKQNSSAGKLLDRKTRNGSQESNIEESVN